MRPDWRKFTDANPHGTARAVELAGEDMGLLGLLGEETA